MKKRDEKMRKLILIPGITILLLLLLPFYVQTAEAVTYTKEINLYGHATITISASGAYRIYGETESVKIIISDTASAVDLYFDNTDMNFSIFGTVADPVLKTPGNGCKVNLHLKGVNVWKWKTGLMPMINVQGSDVLTICAETTDASLKMYTTNSAAIIPCIRVGQDASFHMKSGNVLANWKMDEYLPIIGEGTGEYGNANNAIKSGAIYLEGGVLTIENSSATNKRYVAIGDGGKYSGTPSNLTIDGGKLIVDIPHCTDSSYLIRAKQITNCGQVFLNQTRTIYGDFILDSDFNIASGETLIIASNANLTNPNSVPFVNNGTLVLNGMEMKAWQGNGTSESPYIIESMEDLSYLSFLVNLGNSYAGYYFKLANDIVAETGWVPIGTAANNFCGSFDGDMHTVTLSIHKEESNLVGMSLFGHLGAGAQIENLGTLGSIATAGKFAGGIAGYAENGAITIANCWSDVAIDFTTGGDATAGGIIGVVTNNADVTLNHCYFTGSIVSSADLLDGVAGLCGWMESNNSTLAAANCYVAGTFGTDSTPVNSGENLIRRRSEGSITITNCYYLNKVYPDSVQGTQCSEEDVANGRLTYLLNGDQSSIAYGQTLLGTEKDLKPVIIAKDNSNQVCAVHFDANGGDGTGVEYYNNGMLIAKAADPTTTRKVAFQGWYTGTDADHLNDSAWDFDSQTVSGDITLYAKWVYIYNISALSSDLEGNSIGNVSGTGTYHEGDQVRLTAAYVIGYNFTGWYDAENQKVAGGLSYEFMAEKDITLYAKYSPVPSYNFTATATDGKLSVALEGGILFDSGTSYHGVLKIGTSVLLTVEPLSDGGSFLYWLDHNGRIYSYNSTISVKVAATTNLTAVFTNKTSSLVQYKNSNGQLLSSTSYDSTITDYTYPSDLYTVYIGYTFVGWSLTQEQILEQIQNGVASILVTPVYEKNVTTYSVTVNNGTGTGEYEVLTKITITANAPTLEGQQFAYWTDGQDPATGVDRIISYNSNYTFTVTSTVTLTAVYTNTPVQESVAINMISITTDPATGMMSFIAERSVPSSDTVLQHGIIITNNAALGDSGFVIGADGVLKGTAMGTAHTGSYIVRKKNVSTGQTWYARGYVVYQDLDGNINTVYSTILSGTM